MDKPILLVRSDVLGREKPPTGVAGDFPAAGISNSVQYLGVCGHGGRLTFIVRIGRVETLTSQKKVGAKRHPQRIRIHYEEYLPVYTKHRVWESTRRNPVHYADFEFLRAQGVNIDPEGQAWEKIGAKITAQEAPPTAALTGLESGIDIPTAKRLIALRMGIPPDAVEITIRG